MSTTDVEKIAVLGAGSWGTALASLLARHGHPTVLWGRDANVIEAIDQRHENPRICRGLLCPNRCAPALTWPPP
jgi:glycerol-3-phosphate dehydrogenase (NAD(P)+)